MGVPGPFLNRRNILSVRNGVLLYKQLIRPMVELAYPICRFAARSHIQKLQELQSKSISIPNNEPWYIGNSQIQEDLGIPFFADHIRELTEIFDSKLADAPNHFVRQIGRNLCRQRVE
jgi:hypothetical protein